MLKKSIILIMSVVLVLTVSACSTNSGNNEAPDLEPDPTEDVSPDNGSNAESEPDAFVFVPSVAVPAGLPIFPDAILRNDLTGGGEGKWQWHYQTTGSGSDIVEFFVEALQGLGFEINYDYTFAEREEFFVSSLDNIVSVYYLDDGVDDATADTPNRWYGIIVDLEGWSAR